VHVLIPEPYVSEDPLLDMPSGRNGFCIQGRQFYDLIDWLKFISLILGQVPLIPGTWKGEEKAPHSRDKRGTVSEDTLAVSRRHVLDHINHHYQVDWSRNQTLHAAEHGDEVRYCKRYICIMNSLPSVPDVLGAYIEGPAVPRGQLAADCLRGEPYAAPEFNDARIRAHKLQDLLVSAVDPPVAVKSVPEHTTTQELVVELSYFTGCHGCFSACHAPVLKDWPLISPARQDHRIAASAGRRLRGRGRPRLRPRDFLLDPPVHLFKARHPFPIQHPT